MNHKRKNRMIIPTNAIEREIVARRLFAFFAFSFVFYLVSMGYNLSQVLIRAQYTEMAETLQLANNDLESEYYGYLKGVDYDFIAARGFVEPSRIHYAEMDKFALLTNTQ